MLGNGDIFSAEDAVRMVEQTGVDGVVVGRELIANPDLVERMQNDWPLTEVDMRRGYGGGEEGYNDYPTWQEQQAQQQQGPVG